MTKDFVAVVDNYNYVPNTAANSVGLALVSLLLIFQTGLGIHYRQWWMLVSWFIGIVFAIVGYAFRVRASLGYYDDNQFKIQYAFFILTPAFIMAGIYFQMSKILTIYGLQFASFKPMFYTGVFIGCDLVSIIVQAIGGGLAVSNTFGTANIGRWIVLAGICFQVVSMIWFIYLFLRLIFKIYRASPETYDPQFAHIRNRKLFPLLVPAVIFSWVWVFIRSIFRLVELGEGWVAYLSTHERYFLVLEGLVMVFAMTTLTLVYPGFCYGREVPVQGLSNKKHFQEDSESLGKFAGQESIQ